MAVIDEFWWYIYECSRLQSKDTVIVQTRKQRNNIADPGISHIPIVDAMMLIPRVHVYICFILLNNCRISAENNNNAFLKMYTLLHAHLIRMLYIFYDDLISIRFVIALLTREHPTLFTQEGFA